MRTPGAIGVAIVLLLLALASTAEAQTFSTADLEGTWEVFQLATPRIAVTGDGIRTYRGEVTFDANGVLVGINPIADNDPVTGGNTFLATGNFSVTVGGVVKGTLNLTNTDSLSTLLSGTFVVAEARLLANRHTIVGTATVAVSGDSPRAGLFTLAKREDGQTFTVADLGADTTRDWNYHEITPSNPANQTVQDGAAWVNGSITFHGTDANPGCTSADLALSDGTIVAERVSATSFG
jgi:hypothetical protein